MRMEAMHEPVLMDETLAALAIAPNDLVVDATLGGGGHFKRLLAALGEGGTLIGIDADPEALERARKAYAEERRPMRPVAHLVNDNFRNLSRILARLRLERVDAILFDLGWSGYQVASSRGFSFTDPSQPLLMTYASSGETAADILNGATEEELADLIFAYGDERFSRGIARAIVMARGQERLLTTGQLVEAVEEGTPEWYHRRRIHPATKTFQALRIAVNDEFGALKEGLAAALSALAPGGRLAVISFHSSEDRIVKSALKEAEQGGLGSVPHKKPVVPTRAEATRNRRARSAKLRVFKRSHAISLVSPRGAAAGTAALFSYV